MPDMNDLRKLNKEIMENYDDYIAGLEEKRRKIEIAKKAFENTENIISDLDTEFSEKTGIFNSKDLSLLFVATGMLCSKWLIMKQVLPLDFDFKYEKKPIEDRLTDKEGDKLANEKLNESEYGNLKDENDTSSNGYRTVNQIIFRPVPYDAMKKIDTADMLKGKIGLGNIGGSTHRAYTMGHDPVWGWIFGTINIMTRSITLKNPKLDTYSVTEEGLNIISEPKSNILKEIKNAIESTIEDHKRLPAAVYKQSLHFLSDKYTKQGLPIPFLSAEKAQELIKKGWNSVEVGNAIKKFLKKSAKLTGTIALQFSISFLINMIIKAIHLMLYDEKKDGNFKLYEVRTRRIIKTANVISSSSNLLVSAGFALAKKDVMNGVKQLDLGGYIETIHRLITDTKFIKEIKREYIVSNFEAIALGYDDSYENNNNCGGKSMAINKSYRQGADDVGKIAAKAFNHLNNEINVASQHQKERWETQVQINKEIFKNQDEHRHDLDQIMYGHTPLDMKSVYEFPPEIKGALVSLLLKIQCDGICKQYIAAVISLLGTAPIPNGKDIQSLSGQYASAAVEFIYKIIALSDYNEYISDSAQKALNTLTISKNDQDVIKSKIDCLKEDLNDKFSTYLFDEINAPEKFARKAVKISVIKRPISAIIAGKSGARLKSLITSIFDSKYERTCVKDNIAYYFDKEKFIQIYEIPEITLGNENKSIDTIKDIVSYKDINILLYCVNVQSQRFEDYEINLISNIKHKFTNIAVYIVLTGCVNIQEANELADYIRLNTNKNTVFLVLEKDYKTDAGICKAFGVKEMLEDISND